MSYQMQRFGVSLARTKPELPDTVSQQAAISAGGSIIASGLKSVLSIASLDQRPSRPPDHAAENRALIALARQLAISPAGILQTLAETALQLCGAHSAGISLLEPDGKRFHWPAIAGQWAEHVGGGTPRDFGPCGTVLDFNVPLLFSHPERDFDYFAPVTPLVEEALLMPFYVDGNAVGTIWVIAHDNRHRFELEDLRLMTNLGTFAASAYQILLSLNAMQKVASVVESSDDAIVTKDLVARLPAGTREPSAFSAIRRKRSSASRSAFSFQAKTSGKSRKSLSVSVAVSASITTKPCAFGRTEARSTFRLRSLPSKTRTGRSSAPQKSRGTSPSASGTRRKSLFWPARRSIEPRTCWQRCRPRFISQKPTRSPSCGRRSKGASRPLRMFIRFSSTRVGQVPSFEASSRRSLPPTAGT